MRCYKHYTLVSYCPDGNFEEADYPWIKKTNDFENTQKLEIISLTIRDEETASGIAMLLAKTHGLFLEPRQKPNDGWHQKNENESAFYSFILR